MANPPEATKGQPGSAAGPGTTAASPLSPGDLTPEQMLTFLDSRIKAAKHRRPGQGARRASWRPQAANSFLKASKGEAIGGQQGVATPPGGVQDQHLEKCSTKTSADADGVGNGDAVDESGGHVAADPTADVDKRVRASLEEHKEVIRQQKRRQVLQQT